MDTAATAPDAVAPRSAMRVSDIMQTDVLTVTRATSVRDVAMLLADHAISGVPVVEDGELLGVISERDLLEKQRPPQPRPDGLLGWFLSDDQNVQKHWARTAGEAMTAPVLTIAPHRPVAAAASLMADYGIKRLPVVRDGALVGIVTRGDVVRAFARSDADIARDISQEVVLGCYWISPADIEVLVEDGHVTLGGRLDSESAAESLPDAVATVPGVVSVESHLIVRP
jgi:CBS domain-containing protein